MVVRKYAGLLLIVLAACAKHEVAPAVRPNISGVWTLNAAESSFLTRPDSTGERGDNLPRIFGRRGSLGGRGGRGMPGSLPGSRADAVEARLVLQSLARSMTQLTLSQDDSTVTVIYADSTTVRLRVDGKKHKHLWRGLGEVETKAKWQEGLLLVAHELDSGLELEEQYSRAPGSPRLIVATTLKGGIASERKGQRVYDQKTE